MSLAMSLEERQAFLADLHVGIVSIPRPDRGPLTVPIWYDYEPGGEVWMITDRTSLKGRLLEQCERISLCAQTETAPYQYVSVEGSFTIEPTVESDLLNMAVRYLGPTQGSEYAKNGAGPDSVTIRLETANWLSVDYNNR